MRYCHFRKIILPAVLALTGIIVCSCLKDIPETSPSGLTWDPELAFPLGEDSYGFNEISDITLLDIDTVTRIPNWVREYSVTIEGSMNFDLSIFGERTGQINSVLMRVNIYNGYPDTIMAQAYFMGSDQEPIDSMFEVGAVLVPGGNLVDDGSEIDPAHKREDATFDRDRLDLIQAATEIWFQATIPLDGLDTSLIPFYPDYHIDIEAGVMLDLSIDFD